MKTEEQVEAEIDRATKNLTTSAGILVWQDDDNFYFRIRVPENARSEFCDANIRPSIVDPDYQWDGRNGRHSVRKESRRVV